MGGFKTDRPAPPRRPRDSGLRTHLARLLSWAAAHVTFDDAITGIPVSARGTVPAGLPYSAWQLLEHIRLAQSDILEFCVRKHYKEKAWPADFWPEDPQPPSRRAWAASVARVRRDRRALERMALNARIDLMTRVPAGSGQTYLREIILAADHTAYHVGQLVAVRRLLGLWGTA